MGAKEEGGRGGVHWEFGVDRGKRLHLEWINNKVLLRNSTGKDIQYPVGNHKGKHLKRMYICI